MCSYYRGIFALSAFKMTRLTLLASLAGLVMASSTSLFADDLEPPLFVAAGGADKGNCQSIESPCLSVAYALRNVGKNGQIRFGDGSFEVDNVADVIYMLSGSIDVQGGYPAGAVSTLIGVPPAFASELQEKGFRVITDAKGIDNAMVQKQLSLKSNLAATECSGGFADAFPCSNVDLLSHVADRTSTRTWR